MHHIYIHTNTHTLFRWNYGVYHFQIELNTKFIHNEYISMSFSFFGSKVMHSIKFNDGNVLTIQQKIEKLYSKVEEEKFIKNKNKKKQWTIRQMNVSYSNMKIVTEISLNGIHLIGMKRERERAREQEIYIKSDRE